MKVTVNFNGTKIVVPCGDGDMTVRDLTALSGTRYKKAIGKYRHGAHWVSVSCLRSHEGGMLDPDDLICDVCDDREQLEAVFHEQSSGHAGDGMSSEDGGGTAFINPQLMMQQQQFIHYDEPLQIRRGSEPSLNKSPQHHAYRQFVTATPVSDFVQHPPYASSSSSTLVPQQLHEEEDGSEAFDSLPDSVVAAASDSKGSLNVLRRREPLGASAGNNNKQEKRAGGGGEQQHQLSLAPTNEVGGAAQQRQQMVRPSVEIIIPNEIGPLGIHVVPSRDEGPGPLIVQGIEARGRVARDGRLAVGDEITEINGYALSTVSFAKAQEVFKEALSAKELKLRVVKGISDVVAANLSAEDKENNLLDRKANNMTEQAPPPPPPPPDSPVVGCKVTAAVQANNTRKIGRVIRIALVKGPSGLGFSITTRDNAPGGNAPVYIKNIMPKGAAIEEGTLKSGDRLLEVNNTSVDGMSQADVVALLRNVETNSRLELAVSRHSVGYSGDGPESGSGTLKRVQIKEDPTKEEEEDEKEGKDEQDHAMEQANYVKLETADRGGDDSSGSGSLNFPWRQREILTFDIPVHDSELAGLGVSVKGKTSTNGDGEVVDLGIFVKSVLHGGAASRDGRLRTNDQLVNINGASLLGKPNPQAMETLRKAMHEEGPTPGIISLTVARQATLLPNSASRQQQQQGFSRGGDNRESFSSQVTSSSNDDQFREYSVSAPIFKQPRAQQQQHQQHQSVGLVAGRNPVIDRLMGKESAGLIPANMRNESYYMATHDTWNATITAGQPPQQQQPKQQLKECHLPTGESLMIEQAEMTSRSEGGKADATCGSVASLAESFQAFARDQPGRQSMSEKRHATLDAKATDTYQKRKKARDERLRLQQQEHRAMRWKKSASVESLHLIGAAEARQKGQRGSGQRQLEYLTPEEREALKTQYVRASSVRVSRSRGCNESFRQAVDRSYEGEEGAAEGEDYEIEDDDDAEVAGVINRGRAGAGGRGSERDHLSAKKKNRNSKLLRNFGAMFRFGSGGRGGAGGGAVNKHQHHRKSTPNTPTPNSGAGVVPRPSTTSLPLSQSVPDYQAYGKNRSGGDLATSSSATDFVRPYQPQQHQHHQHQYLQDQPQPMYLPHQRQPQQQYLPPHQQQYLAPRHPPQDTYDYLPSAMMRPGSRVGIADPGGAAAAASDYEVIQRHLHRTRVPYQSPPRQQPDLNFHHHQQQQVTHRHPRSHSNPARARPKSNFYEYDMWSGGGMDSEQSHLRAPPVPQKPSERAVQQHLSNIAATDPNLYGATNSAHEPYGYNWQQKQLMQQQQQQRPRATSSMDHQINPQHYSVRGGQQNLH